MGYVKRNITLTQASTRAIAIIIGMRSLIYFLDRTHEFVTE